MSIEHNEQQTAAAQEAVAWMTRKALDRFAEHRAGNADAAASSYAYAMPDDDCFVPLYAAPVTAAPVDLDALAVNRYRPVPDGLLAYKVVAGDGTRSLFSGTMNECNVVARKLTEAFLDGAHVASTPAAPGIGLQAFRKVAMPLLCQMLCSHDAERVARKLHAALLDASPKGATFPNDGNSEAQAGDAEVQP